MSASAGKVSLGLAAIAIILAGAAIAQSFTLAGIGEKVDMLSGQITGVQGKLADMEGKVSGISGQLSGLAAKVAPKTQNITVIMGEGEVIEEIDGKETLTGEFHRWEPDVIVVRKGDTVILNVRNPRSHAHSLVLTAFEADTGVLAPRGGAKTVQFVANKAGVFEYRCGLPPDEALGYCDPDHRRQVGYLIVLDG